MTIVRLRKVTVYGPLAEKEHVLDGLQELGALHLVKLAEVDEEVDRARLLRTNARKALAYLESCPMRRHQALRTAADFDPDALERETLQVRRESVELQDEVDELRAKVKALEPWGDFRAPSRDELLGLRFWYFVVPHYKMRDVEATDLTWAVVQRDATHAYVVVISAMEPAGMPVLRSRTGKHPLSELETMLDGKELRLEELQARRVQLTRYIDLLREFLRRTEDQADLIKAAMQTWDDSGIFAVRAWATEGDVPAVRRFTDGRRLALIVEAPSPDDAPPTLLRNPPALASGEQLSAIFRTPAYRAWDPSIIVFVSFALFFAMIVSDAGYAAVFGVMLVFLWGRMGASEGGRRMRALFTALVGASLVYGVLVGSYFGLDPTPGGLLARLKVLSITDTGAMMRLSIVLGAIHLVLANAIVAWNGRASSRALASVGWCAAILGGLAFWLFGLDDPSGIARPIALTTVGSGLAAVLFFSSDRPFPPRGVRDLIGRVLDGLLGLTNVSRAFGDVLSYLRLFALGLSSAYLALTFNQIAGLVMDKSPGIGVAVAAFLLLFGHGLNLALCVMAGVVHGLRLNYIEFFGWGLTDEGHPFRAFRKRAT